MSEVLKPTGTPLGGSQEPAALVARLAGVLDEVPDGVVIVDREWRFLHANQRALELLNDPSIVGENIFKRFPGNLEEPFYTAYRTSMDERVETSFEAFHSAPLELWLRVTARPHPDGIVVFFSDITQRKLAELREVETARRLAEVLEATSDAVATLDREWRFTFLNGRAQKLLRRGNELLGKNAWEEFPLAVGTPAWDLLHRSMNEGCSGHTEVFYPEPINALLAVQSEPAPDGLVVFFRDITEQRRHDDLIREQQELLGVVQRAARVATWQLNPLTGQVIFGPGSYDVLGHAAGAVNDMAKLDRILLPGHAARLRDSVKVAVKTGSQVTLEMAAVAADGSTVWVESRGQAVKQADGTPLLRGMSIDITERKQNEQKLIASEERYRVLADLNPQAIWMGDAAGNVTYANQGFLSYLGLTAGQLTGLGWLEAFAPDDRQRVVEVWTRSVTTGVEYEIEALLRDAAANQHRYWHLRAAPVRDSSGAILHWLGVARDIHDEKTLAASLRAEQIETEQRRAELETLYQTTPVGLAVHEPLELRYMSLNDRMAEMLGRAKNDVLGRPLAEIVPETSMPGMLELVARVARGEVVRDAVLEGELPSRGGERQAWSVNCSPIFSEDGGRIRAISTASIEITNQKKAEAALIQSEKLAAVGRLASSISHEINNPLEAITNLLYLIAHEEKLPEELKLYVHMAQSELSRVSQIATQTLRFHRQAVRATQVTAEELVGAVVRLYTGRLANSNIRIDARYNTQTQVLCFENDIRQVLNNLIANAIDAMRKGGRLIVRAHAGRARWKGSDGREGVRITIADTGHGMEPAVAARIFEPFYTTKDLQGTGLGLWISLGIVERHKGRLSVRSSTAPRHQGTIFTLFLPCDETS